MFFHLTSLKSLATETVWALLQRLSSYRFFFPLFSWNYFDLSTPTSCCRQKQTTNYLSENHIEISNVGKDISALFTSYASIDIIIKRKKTGYD